MLCVKIVNADYLIKVKEDIYNKWCYEYNFGFKTGLDILYFNKKRGLNGYS